MRGAPPVEVRVRRQGSWRAFVVVLVALTAGSIGVWLAASEAGITLKVALALATIAVGLAALSTAAPLDITLRWTGATWVLRRQPASDEHVGSVTVALDLGNWMLLRFIGEPPRARAIWLPVQRRGLDGDWHALRCAVHAPPALPQTP
jgi:hypothetical protein